MWKQRTRYFLFCMLGILFLWGTGGCGATDRQDRTQQAQTAAVPLSPPLSGSAALTPADRAIFTKLSDAVTRAQTVAKELDFLLAEMQHQDELHEAQEMIQTARREILLIWNVVHNELHPADPALRQRKTQFETILASYRQGITDLLTGMEKAEAKQTVEGFEQTARAKQKLDRFSLQ
ncbi:hypothetical protein JQN58_18225 [Aneurinibacillus sp. BA2021]|nr:hypothetical protein [Aneurinibacillus sp. BA2021]